MIELKYRKNEKFEIEVENLGEVKKDSKILLKLKDGDLTPLFQIADKLLIGSFVYIPYLPKLNDELRKLFVHFFFNKFSISIRFFDCYNEKDTIPNWSEYIDKDSAVLFLNLADCERYQTDEFSDAFDYSKVFLYPNIEHRCNKMICMSSDCTGIKDFKIISIIIPELTSKNIQEINDIAKELKEKHGIERVELFASHCFVEDNFLGGGDIKFVDKITTTNSTGVLEVQDSERLKVADVKEFFE